MNFFSFSLNEITKLSKKPARPNITGGSKSHKMTLKSSIMRLRPCGKFTLTSTLTRRAFTNPLALAIWLSTPYSKSMPNISATLLGMAQVSAPESTNAAVLKT